MKKNKNTYISLFSSAGVGCFGFKEEEFQCVATNEFEEKRIAIQIANEKCKYPTGYICGDIKTDDVKNRIYNEIEMWKSVEKTKEIDVVVATPPCQGMSVANHKKNENDEIRNSLVIESLILIKNINPKFFIIENVSAFLKTECEDVDGVKKSIKEAIDSNLSERYEVVGKVINFKNYGNNSSRTRTVVIGVRKDYITKVTPNELFPDYQEEKSIKDVIGYLPRLKTMGEINSNDIYHSFRPYDVRMLPWISNTGYGKSAFDNEKAEHRPHKIVDGVIVQNTNKNGDKYKRQTWEKTAPCIHTRNDILASQSTVHPEDNRVFSVRELMNFMTIPKHFKWSSEDVSKFSLDEKKAHLKKYDTTIRTAIGEAVPTSIFKQIAFKIKSVLNNDNKGKGKYFQEVKNIEETNAKREETAAFYTDSFLAYYVVKNLPQIDKKEITVLEPSVGGGIFVPYLVDFLSTKYNKVKIILNDLDIDTLERAKKNIENWEIPGNVKISFENKNYLDLEVSGVDIIVGNPPYLKHLGYKSKFGLTNLYSIFLEKGLSESKTVSLIIPKSFLGSSENKELRTHIANNCNLDCVLDFGEKGFKDVKIETINVCVSIIKKSNNKTFVYGLTENKEYIQSQDYITDNKYPSWLIYRDKFFDKFIKNLKLNVFSVFRDRQISKKDLSSTEDENSTRVLVSKNIDQNGNLVNDSTYFINANSKAGAMKFKDTECIAMPNMTYYPRAIIKQKNQICDGSLALLFPKDSEVDISKLNLSLYASDEFRQYYKTVRNKATRTLNIDDTYVYYIGINK